MSDWREVAAQSPAWGEFLRFVGLDPTQPYYLSDQFMTKWHTFQAGVIVGQQLAMNPKSVGKLLGWQDE